ncbi:MAG: radical SAM/SPASM domain-containing protein [Flexilinea sp.]
MSLTPIIRKPFGKVGMECLISATPLLAHSRFLRRTFLQATQKYVKVSHNSVKESSPRPSGVDEDRYDFSEAIWHTADRILEHKLSRPVIRSITNNLVNGIMVEGGKQTAMTAFHEKYGTNPPGFLTISPGKACNLQCTGCYASAGPDAEKLDWNTFDRIITEAKSLWGVRFLVISGGEPLAYHSEGKGILDAAERHPDIFFLMYTNGTLIDEKVAKRMAKLGNITPAISVEGWRESTDERRGTGVYDKVLEAMKRLRLAGVPFGISLTATRNNVEEIFSDEFIDFFFEKQGAIYGWIFHYMPIGRSFTLDLMPTPKQRIWMWNQIWDIIRQRHIFLADFWNHGTLSDGCLASGRSNGGGYLYINWNGAVSPCVFVPYSPVNICDVYAHGGTINDVWNKPFFAGIRNWQNTYRKENGNWLAPCIIRDHHKVFRNLLAQHEPDPTDENAQKALMDPDYASGLEEYDVTYQALSGLLWEKYYLKTDWKPETKDQLSSESKPLQTGSEL